MLRDARQAHEEAVEEELNEETVLEEQQEQLEDGQPEPELLDKDEESTDSALEEMLAEKVSSESSVDLMAD